LPASRPLSEDVHLTKEITRLRTENERLRNELAAATSKPSDAPPQIEDFQEFVKRFSIEVQKELVQQNKEKFSGFPDGGVYEQKNVVEVMSVDLKKSDSISTPIVGVAALRDSFSRKRTQPVHPVSALFATKSYVFTFAKKSGQWVPLKLTVSTDSILSLPQSDTTHDDHPGVAVERPVSSWIEIAKRAN